MDVRPTAHQEWVTLKTDQREIMVRKKALATSFYEINCDYRRGAAPGWKILNYDRLQANKTGIRSPNPWPDGYLRLPLGPWRFPEFAELPLILIDKKLGREPRDLENIEGFFFISAATKAVFEDVDPGACDFRRCETVLPSGEPGRETWICTVTRAFRGVIDPAGSQSLISMAGDGGLPAYGATPSTKLKLNEQIIDGAHLFHIAEMSRQVFCDENLKQASQAANLKGIFFRPVSK